MARVRPDEAASLAAYRYFNAFGGWVADPSNYTIAVRGPGRAALSYNAYLGAFTAVSASIWDVSVELRRSPAPTGPFAEPEGLVDAIPTDGFFIAGGSEHAALRSVDGRTLAITYFTRSSTRPSGLHLVSYRLR